MRKSTRVLARARLKPSQPDVDFVEQHLSALSLPATLVAAQVESEGNDPAEPGDRQQHNEPYLVRLRPRINRVCYTLPAPPVIRRTVRNRHKVTTRAHRTPTWSPSPDPGPSPDSQDEWQVDRVVDKHDDGSGKLRYRVQWAGFPASSST